MSTTTTASFTKTETLRRLRGLSKALREREGIKRFGTLQIAFDGELHSVEDAAALPEVQAHNARVELHATSGETRIMSVAHMGTDEADASLAAEAKPRKGSRSGKQGGKTVRHNLTVKQNDELAEALERHGVHADIAERCRAAKAISIRQDELEAISAALDADAGLTWMEAKLARGRS